MTWRVSSIDMSWSWRARLSPRDMRRASHAPLTLQVTARAGVANPIRPSAGAGRLVPVQRPGVRSLSPAQPPSNGGRHAVRSVETVPVTAALEASAPNPTSRGSEMPDHALQALRRHEYSRACALFAVRALPRPPDRLARARPAPPLSRS